ncbi:ROK family protein [Tropicimonas sp. IMCC34043]|uniref:ROK family protein n=1 Tax=Tropicimonas sp. IMCC34043 TaxID=2248760 RepID=UPI0013008320|nr:ROK family protein [Tropicimonas sp. IMCC34043]
MIYLIRQQTEQNEGTVQTGDHQTGTCFDPPAISGAVPGTGSHADAQAIGLDIGGTKLHAGTTTPGGSFGHELLEPTAAASEDLVFAQIVKTIATLRDARPTAAVAIGVPASVDQAQGTLELSPNIPFTPDRPLGEDLGIALGMPVILENDVNLAALAEARLGAGRGLDLVCFLSFGTGVGLGLVSRGRILRGASGRAGEISYLPVAADAAAEAAVSEAGQFEDRVGTASLRARYGKDMPDVRTLFARADDGDRAAAAAIAETAADAARGLASLQAILDPDLIVIGGGIGMQRRFYDRMRSEAERLLPFSLAVAQASLGPAAGMMGAVVLASDLAGLPLPRPASAPAPTDTTGVAT